MPSKNSIKSYVANSYYHIYNRGVEKRKIFLDDLDYKVFLSYLKIYLQPPMDREKITIKIGGSTFNAHPRPLKNYNDQIELVAYCLMPNHFHLLIYQKSEKGMEFFMRSLATKYSQYFNKKYNRVGYLFQSTYKAVMVDKDEYLLHLSRYIHLNPYKETPLKDAYSSYREYLGLRKTDWIKSRKVLEYFSAPGESKNQDFLSYQSFVEDSLEDPKENISELVID